MGLLFRHPGVVAGLAVIGVLCAPSLAHLQTISATDETATERPASPAGSISAAAAFEQVQQHHAYLLDVRKRYERKGSPVGLCAHITFFMDGTRDEDFVADVLAAVDGNRDAAIILISKAGVRSQKAQSVLAANGFPHVTSIDGGFQAWVASNLPH